MTDPIPHDDAGNGPGEPLEDHATRVLRIFIEEPMLWPVGLVVLLCASSFGAFILVFAIRLRSLGAGLALLVLIFLTVWKLDADIRARRLRPTSVLLLGLWAGSAVVGVALEWLGAFH
jgi:hypothetical protein